MSVRVWRTDLPSRRERLAELILGRSVGEALQAPTLYLCATAPLLEAARAIFLSRPARVPPGPGFAGYPGRGAAGVDFLLLPWMARNLLEAAGEPAVTLGAAGRYAVVERAIREVHAAGDLEAFAPVAETPGFARSVAGLIGELKRAGVSPDAFAAAAERLDPAERYRQLAGVYRRVQALLAELGALDPDDVEPAALARADADGGAWFRRYARLVVDGFVGLTPVQRRLLARALRAVPEADVLWPADPPGASALATERLTALLTEAGVEARVEDAPGPLTVAAATVERLLGANPEDEARGIAGRVKDWILTGRVTHPGDIAVVAGGDADDLVRALEREGVPVRSDRGVPLDEVPAVRALLRLWDAAAAPDTAALLAVLSSSYFAWPRPADPDLLDQAYRALGRPAEADRFLERLRARREAVERAIRLLEAQLGGVPADVEGGPDADEGDGGRRALLARDRARRVREAGELGQVLEACEAARRLLEGVPRAGPAEALVEAMRRLAADLDLEGRAADPRTGPGAMARDLRGLQAFWAAAAEVARVAGSEPVTLADLSAALQRAVAGLRVLPPRRRPGGVRILSPAQVTGLRVPVVVVAGCVEGRFPRAFAPDWLLPEPERRRLRAAGVELDLLEDRHRAAARGFWDAAAAAGDVLLVSHPRAAADGTPFLASRYLEQLPATSRAEAPTSGRPSQTAPRPDETPLAPAELLRRATRLPELVAGVTGVLYGPAWRRGPGDVALARALARRLEARGPLDGELAARLEADRQREGPRFGPWDGALADPAVRAAVADRFAPGRALSPTALNHYGICGFLFFAGTVLGLEPRKAAADAWTSMEFGSLAHEALRRFVSEYRDTPWPPPREAGRQRLTELAKELAEASLAEGPHFRPSLVALQVEQLEGVLHAWLEHEHKFAEARTVAVRPAFVEVSFGMPAGPGADPRSQPEPLVLEGDDGTRLAVRGKVDRVDVADDGRYLVYDYKWSRGRRRVEDLVDGFEFQIPLYLRAVAELLLPGREPAGGAYYGLADGHRGVGLWREDGLGHAGLEARRVQPLDPAAFAEHIQAAAARALEFARAIRSAAFDLNPRRCLGDRCDFWGACRYDRRRVGGKAGAHVR